MRLKLLLLSVYIVVLTGCTSAKLDSYVNPSYNTKGIMNIAVMPLSNQRINAGQAIELNKAFIQEIKRRNPNIGIVAGQDAIRIVNEKGLADRWSDFLIGYSTSGLPNTNTLYTLSTVLNVDAIIQGTILHVKQEDSDGWKYPITQVTVRYTMFGGKDGAVLWELTGEGKIQPYGYSAPPVFEAAKMAHDKILEQLPF